jgi:hypothetical protein
MPSVVKYLPDADILDCNNYGTKGRAKYGQLYTKNYRNYSMLKLALEARQIYGDSPISDSKNPISDSKNAVNYNRSKFRHDVVKLLLEKATRDGIVDQLFNEEYLNAPTVIDILLGDNYSDYNKSKPYMPTTFTYKTAVLLVSAKPDIRPTTSEGYLMKQVIMERLANRDPTHAQLAIAAPYKRKVPELQQYMSLLPDAIRERIIYFLRNPIDQQRRMFPLIVRELQLPPIISEQALELLKGPVVHLPLLEDVVESVLSLSPIVSMPKSQVAVPSPAHLSIISDSSPARSRKSVKKCPPGKEINPKTGRCIKSCTRNQIRNTKTGRCVNAKNSSPSRKERKECPPGKELNPETGRCRKSCERDKVRNKNGRCVSK